MAIQMAFFLASSLLAQPSTESLAVAPLALQSLPNDAESLHYYRHANDDVNGLFLAKYNPDGRPRNIAGRLWRAESLLPSALEDAVFEFLASQDQTFHLNAPGAPELILESVATHEAGVYATLLQSYNGIPILRGDLVASYDSNGVLFGLHGVYWSDIGSRIDLEASAPTKADLLSVDLPSDDRGMYTDAIEHDSYHVAINPSPPALVWIVDTENYRFTVDPATKTAKRTLTSEDFVNATVGFWDYNYATEHSSQRIAYAGTSTLVDDCAGPAIFLHRVDVTRGHWVECVDYTEATLACSGSPNFSTSSDAHYKRQNDAFIWASIARSEVTSWMWSLVSPSRSNDVRIALDEVTSHCSTSACFHIHSGTPTIHIEEGGDPNAEPWDLLLHEYGHYMAWTYGDMADGCEWDVDESDAVDEAVADLHTYFIARKHSWVVEGPAGYRTPTGVNDWDRLIDSVAIEDGSGIPRCFPDVGDTCHHDDTDDWCEDPPFPSDPNYNRRNMANTLRAALWQLMHNIRCARPGRDCTDSSTNNVSGANDIGWLTQTVATNRVMTALAWALASTSSAMAQDDITFWMYYYWGSVSGETTQATNAAVVFTDHGIHW